MPTYCLVLLLSGLLTSLISAEPYNIELDFDGILGNGPDVVSAQPGDTLAVDVWCMGTGSPIWDINLYLCTKPDQLSFAKFQNATAMSMPPPIDQGDGCWNVIGVDYASGFVPPFLYGIASYTVASDNMCDWIDVDPALSFWSNLNFTVGLFENNTPAGVLVNTAEDCFTTGTRESHWGEIKTLFR